MKKFLALVPAWIGMLVLNTAWAVNGEMRHENHQHDMSMMDMRIPLGLSPEMKQHQLSNMRDHVETVKTIVGLIAENKFAEAAEIAHAKLGLTPEMQGMCKLFENEKFRALGLAFHKSGDELGDALQTKDVNVSLRALNRTMQYCVECHAAFRQ